MTDSISTDVKTAMKAGDRGRAAALRLVLAELQKGAKEEGEAVDEQAILRRERKRRRDAETAFRDAGRAELADQEAAEGAMIDGYLPQPLSEAELSYLVTTAIEQTGAESVRDMGRVIKHAMAAAEGRADGAQVSAKVKAALA